VTETLEHRECSESLGAYALGALPDLEGERVRNHLADCRQCRAELEGLRAAVDALPASVPQIDPPPALKSRLMEIVEAEADLLRAAGEPADKREPKTPKKRARWLTIPIPTPGQAVAYASIIAIAIAVAIGGSGTPVTRTINAQLSGPLLAGGTKAKLQLTGTRAELVVEGLPAPAQGRIDELWVKRGAASPQPSGTFVVTSGSVRVSRPVERGDVVMMTMERAPGTDAPTSAPLIVAHT
jgi:anti-sigma factor RsiW